METWRLVLEIVCAIIWLLFVLILVYGNKQRDKKIEKLQDEVQLLKDGFGDHWFLIKQLLNKEKEQKKEKK